MKIEVEDLDKIISVTGAEDSSGLRMVLARYLINIYDRGMDEGLMNRVDDSKISGECPYAQSHTRDWCDYSGCRES